MKLNYSFKPYPTVLIENMDMYCNFLLLHLYKYSYHKNEKQLQTPIQTSIRNLSEECDWSKTTTELTLQALVNANLIKVELGKNKREKTRVWINYDTIAQYDEIMKTEGKMEYIQKCEKGTSINLECTSITQSPMEEHTVTTITSPIEIMEEEVKPKRRERVKTYTYRAIIDDNEEPLVIPDFEIAGIGDYNFN